MLQEAGLRFGLSDETFARWWSGTLLKEDADEYVNLYRGRENGARLVCAIDYLTIADGRTIGADLIVRAYMLAMGLPGEQDRDGQVVHTARIPKIRIEAQALYDDDATQMLLERVRYRSVMAAEVRIAARTTAVIEKLYDESDEETLFEYRLSLKKVALDASNKFLANRTRERIGHQALRMKKTVAEAIAKSPADDATRPPDKETLIANLMMMKEVLGESEFAEALAAVAPKQISVDGSPS